MSKFILSVLIIGSFLFTLFSSAQTTSFDSQTIIKQIQKQIELLNQRILDLQARLEKTEEEVEAVKIELKLTRSLRKGESGDDVRQLQEFLKQFSDIYPEGLVTGFFGSLTELAVKRFQEKQGIESIGIVGPKTIQKLNEFSVSGSPAIPAMPAVPAETAIPAIPDSLSLPLQPSSPSQEISAPTPSPEVISAIPASPAAPATPAQSASSTPTPTLTSFPSPNPITSPSYSPTPTPAPTSSTTTPIAFSNQAISNITQDSATITFTTNVLTWARVTYGAGGVAPWFTVYESPNTGNYPYTYTTFHTLQLSGLKSNTNYIFTVFVNSTSDSTHYNGSIQTLSAPTPTPTPTPSLNPVSDFPDLALEPLTMSVPPGAYLTPIYPDIPVKISLTIRNSSSSGSVNNTMPQFTVEDAQNTSNITNGTAIGTVFQNVVNNCPANLQPLSSCTGSFELVFTNEAVSGSKAIYVEIDRQNYIPETDESNNFRVIYFTVSIPSPTPAPTSSVSFSPSSQISATASILNALKSALQNLSNLLFQLNR